MKERLKNPLFSLCATGTAACINSNSAAYGPHAEIVINKLLAVTLLGLNNFPVNFSLILCFV